MPIASVLSSIIPTVQWLFKVSDPGSMGFLNHISDSTSPEATSPQIDLGEAQVYHSRPSLKRLFLTALPPSLLRPRPPPTDSPSMSDGRTTRHSPHDSAAVVKVGARLE